MRKLSREDLFPLEQYAERRPHFRAEVMTHKKDRKVHLGSHATLYFEDRVTIQYQIQEMLRVERIFEADAISEELEAYNPLIPDGSNWKATFMIEYEDLNERKRALSRLIGIEDQVWVQVKGFQRVLSIADEDMDRETAEKTSAVHFLRFDLSSEMKSALKSGARLAIGVDHPAYQQCVDPVPTPTRNSLMADLL